MGYVNENVKWAVWISAFAADLPFSIAALTYPFVAREFDVNQTWIGIIFSMTSLLCFLTSIWIASRMHNIGRKRVLIGGLLLAIISNSAFGLTIYAPDRVTFIVTSLLSRMCQGAGAGIATTASYAIITISYPEKMQKYLAITESFTGLAIVIGPIVGTVLNHYGGFNLCMQFCASLISVAAVYSLIIIPKDSREHENELNIQLEQLHGSRKTSEVAQGPISSRSLADKLGLLDLMKNQRFLMDYIALFMSFFILAYFRVTAALFLESIPAFEPYIGELFAIGSGSYILAAIVVAVIPGSTMRRSIIFLGLGILSFCLVFVGPLYITESIQLPNLPALQLLGMVMFGFSGGMIIIPAGPELVTAGQIAMDSRETIINDLAAGAFNNCLGIGSIIGQAFSGWIAEDMGYRTSASVLAGLTILYCIIFYRFNVAGKQETDLGFKDRENSTTV